MLEIVLTPEILGPPKSGTLGLSLFSIMINPHLNVYYYKGIIDLHEKVIPV